MFLLQPGSEGQTSFVMRFSYPTIGSAGYDFSRALAAIYKFSGDRGLFPTAMHDDGKRTTVTWGRQTPLPAVFMMNGRQESVVNGRMVGDNYVIEGTASRWRFRFGEFEVTAVRKVARTRR